MIRSKLSLGVIGSVVLLAACNDPPITPVESTTVVEQIPSAQEITLYLEGMNQRLKILGGDGPNTVKIALAELSGVESVEDEWEREIESDVDLDLLFVKFDPSQVTVDQLKQLIAEHDFEAVLKQE